MDQQQARDLVRDTLGQSFEKASFIRLTRELFNQFDETKAFHARGYVPESYKPYVRTYERIATYTDPDNKKIDILIVYLQKETSLDRARVSQRNFIAHYLKDRDQKDAGLVAFVSPDPADWRFSLVRMDYRLDEKGKIKEELTPARRWSFLVGANETSHTVQSRLAPRIVDDQHHLRLADLEDAFNIEKVTKEFFEKYRELFLRTKEELDAVVAGDEKIRADFTAKNVNTADFAKKLLGQIVFLCFLQKKGWFGVARDQSWGRGSKQFLRELFDKKHGSYENFFNDILEPLFYEALRIDRSHDDHYFSHFHCKIPFLNGGLFDPMNDYDWVRTDILLANELFSNKRQTKEGDAGNGILDIFDRYNFTVKEDEPLEKEVAIDPEMLGKVFENLLEVKDRKSKGTYYTPREIVHYMCRQSLIYYLLQQFNGGAVTYEKTGTAQTDMFGNDGIKGQLDLTVEYHEKTAISEKDIETFIHSGEQIAENDARVEREGRETSRYYYQMPESIRKNAKEIDEKLSSVKVCDPAIGSGAFPVGMMSEIVRARGVLNNFIRDDSRSPYHFKRQCIEKSLYGVDIDPGAVEIAKLRLWLSLVVDENDIKQIKPLPNLDYKIVCGNSLIGFPEGWDSDVTKEIEALKHEHFSETNPAKKNALKSKIDSKISDRYKNSLKTFGYQIDLDFRTAFSEVFHEKNGFDVVIANPPYVRQEAIKAFKPDLAKAFPKFYCGTADLYTYFYQRGIDLLRSGAHLCYIAPNKFMRASYGKNTRRLLAKEVTPRQVIDFGDLPIFDATTYPSIILVQKNRLPSTAMGEGRGGGDVLTATFTDIAQIENTEKTIKEIGFHLSPDDLKEEGWTLERPEILALMDKLRKAGMPLGEYVQGRFYRGILTGLNEAFVIDEATRAQLIAEDPQSAELIKPWLRGRDIKKWKAEWAGLYLLYIPWHFDIKKYPAVLKHLRQFKNKLENRNESERDRYEWYALQRYAADYYKEFSKPKITWGNLATEPKFAFDTSNSYIGAPANIIPTSNLCLLAILNSPISKWWISLQAATRSGGFLEYKPMYVGEIPIPEVADEEKKTIINCIEKILSDPDIPNVAKLEAKIDQMVYKLYGLTPDEIAIVEGKKSLTNQNLGG
ncbi:MAG: restriction endonuclease [Deltaproteobacteria bacterium HGW-Deltaproteobacteria-12]|nr:MAG: restriction endonuclease [Deltaproteobacteria bacterium HGW-Deltaproteobacteria-12]